MDRPNDFLRDDGRCLARLTAFGDVEILVFKPTPIEAQRLGAWLAEVVAWQTNPDRVVEVPDPYSDDARRPDVTHFELYPHDADGTGVWVKIGDVENWIPHDRCAEVARLFGRAAECTA